MEKKIVLILPKISAKIYVLIFAKKNCQKKLRPKICPYFVLILSLFVLIWGVFLRDFLIFVLILRDFLIFVLILRDFVLILRFWRK